MDRPGESTCSASAIGMRPEAVGTRSPLLARQLPISLAVLDYKVSPGWSTPAGYRKPASIDFGPVEEKTEGWLRQSDEWGDDLQGATAPSGTATTDRKAFALVVPPTDMVEEVTLYRAPTTEADADAVGDWLRERVDAAVTVEDRLLGRFADDESVAEAFAETRVLSPYERETGNTMLGIVRYEERTLADPERGGGVIYDGLALQDVLRERLAETAAATGLDHLYVPLLDRALGTWGDHDGRWHKRVAVLGQPSLVSVPGLYEAPAKPESYYKAKQSHALMAGDAPPREVLEQEVEGDFLVADDPRTTDALKGYVLAAYHYLETGEAFCESEGCRLYDAHRQPELIEAQLREPEFCEAHAERYGT